MRNNAYNALMQRLDDPKTKGLKRELYNIMLENANDCEARGMSKEEYLDGLRSQERGIVLNFDDADELFIDYLEDVSEWVADLIKYGDGMDVFIELAESFDDPFCATRDARVWVIYYLMLDLAQNGLDEA